MIADGNPNEGNMIIQDEPMKKSEREIGLDPIEIDAEVRSVGVGPDLKNVTQAVGSKSSMGNYEHKNLLQNKKLNRTEGARSDHRLYKKRKKSRSKDRYEKNYLHFNKNTASPTPVNLGLKSPKIGY